MKRPFLFAAALAVAPVSVEAQDKPLEAVCGDLFGARQTAMRMRDGGFSAQIAINEALARPEWKTASMQNQQLVVRVVQEVYVAPQLQSSEVIREVCRRALDASKPD